MVRGFFPAAGVTVDTGIGHLCSERGADPDVVEPGSDKGRRLDHIWVSPALAAKVTDAGVYRDARGWEKPSDHAPIWADIDI